MNISDINNDGVAFDGIDPVARANGEPLRGYAEHRAQIGDYTYHFVSDANRQKFEAEPGKYLPTPGGFTSAPIRDSINAHSDSTQDKYVGNKTFVNARNIEDAMVSTENGVPNDIKEDGSVEMQNLSDDNN